MSPSLERLERLDVQIPDYTGGDSHPFSKGQVPDFYKVIRDTAEGKTARTHFFEKNLVGIYFALGRPVPYAFRTKDNVIRSLDAGCVKSLCNRRVPELELFRDSDGFIVAVKPLAPLLERYDPLRDALIKPYLILARSLNLPFTISGPIDERRKIESERVIRDGAVTFRRDLLRAWRTRCAISCIGVTPVLEAAHIFPYLGTATNDLRNAILLKSDLHILFDAHLLSIEYADDALIVRISKSLMPTAYARYNGRSINLPAELAHQPAAEVVQYHFEKFRSREQSEL
jgi:hypothetical protein